MAAPSDAWRRRFGSEPGKPSAPELAALRRLDRRARLILGLSTHQGTITAADAVRALGLSLRAARDLLAAWVADGWLEVAASARKSRRYRLSAQ